MADDQPVDFEILGKNPLVAISIQNGVGKSWFEKKAQRLVCTAVVGREALSSPFKYQLRLIAPHDILVGKKEDRLEPTALLGVLVRIQLRVTGEGEKVDKITEREGVFARFKVIGRQKRFTVFEAEVVPAFALLQREVRWRTFEKKTVLQIVGEVLDEAAIAHELPEQDVYPVLEYCVQYGESTFSFVSRLLEENGLFYAFRHDPSKHVLVVIDKNLTATDKEAAGKKFAELKLDGPHELRITGAGKGVTGISDFHEVHDFRSAIQHGQDWEWRQPAPAKGRDETSPTPENQASFGVDLFPTLGRADDRTLVAKELQRQVEVALQGEETRAYLAEGTSALRELTAGFAFFFGESDRPQDEKRPYLVTAIEFTANEDRYHKTSFWDDFLAKLAEIAKGALSSLAAGLGGAVLDLVSKYGPALLSNLKSVPDAAGKVVKDSLSGAADQLAKFGEDKAKALFFESLPAGYHNHFFCTQAALRLRPPRTTPKPYARGPETALVIGPSHDSKDEIHTDPDGLGRVRVLFPWNRFEDEETTGEFIQSSAWVRVSEGWAGKGWGYQHLPRVGQEVVVDFLYGDPDRPVIVGRVYKGNDGKGTHPFPLPKFQTQSGLRTRSTPTPEGAREGFHMLRFDDARDKEQVLLRSQKRYDLRVLASVFETIGGSRNEIIGGKDEKTGEKGGWLVTTVGDEVDLHNHGGRYEKTEEEYNLAVVDDMVADLQADHSLMVKGTLQVNAKRIAIEAQQKITLKVGGSFITLDPLGVTIVGPTVRINSGGAADGTGNVEVTDPADAGVADTGEPGFLDRLPKGGPAKSRKRTVQALHGPVLGRSGNNFVFNRGVQIDGTNRDYAEKVLGDLLTMQATPSGKALLDRLDTSGHTTTITSPGPGTSWLNSGAGPGQNRPQDFAAATPAGQPVFDGSGHPINDPATGRQLTGTGTGIDSRTGYDPNHFPPPPGAPNVTNAPGDVALFHELDHADHDHRGTLDTRPTGGGFDTNEERNTITDENRYRAERGVPARPNHHSY